MHRVQAGAGLAGQRAGPQAAGAGGAVDRASDDDDVRAAQVEPEVGRPAVQRRGVALRHGDEVVDELAAHLLLGLRQRALVQQQQRRDDRGALEVAHLEVVEHPPGEQHGAQRLSAGPHGHDRHRCAGRAVGLHRRPQRRALAVRTAGAGQPAVLGVQRRDDRLRARGVADDGDGAALRVEHREVAVEQLLRRRARPRAARRRAASPRAGARAWRWPARPARSCGGPARWPGAARPARSATSANSEAFSIAMAAWSASEVSSAVSSRLNGRWRRFAANSTPITERPAAQRDTEDGDQPLPRDDIVDAVLQPLVGAVVGGGVGLAGRGDQPAQAGAEPQLRRLEGVGADAVGDPHGGHLARLVVQHQVRRVGVEQLPGPAHDREQDRLEVAQRRQVARRLVERAELLLAPAPGGQQRADLQRVADRCAQRLRRRRRSTSAPGRPARRGSPRAAPPPRAATAAGRLPSARQRTGEAAARRS